MPHPYEPIPLHQPPHRFHTIEQVKIWHARHVLLDSASYEEAAARLDISSKQLWLWRGRYDITESPQVPTYPDEPAP